MLKYSDYELPCFELGSSQQYQSSIRSTFDYGIRQRRAVRGYSTHSVKITLEYFELLSFKTFWDDLKDGNDIFLTDMIVHGDTTIDKEIRFIVPYTLNEVDVSGIWELTSTVELIKTGSDMATQCPLTPSNLLVPSNTLTPC